MRLGVLGGHALDRWLAAVPMVPRDLAVLRRRVVDQARALDDVMILHPKDYTRLRNLTVLRVELGDRVFEALVGGAAWIACPEWFRRAWGLAA